jgi:hypothetical protein
MKFVHWKYTQDAYGVDNVDLINRNVPVLCCVPDTPVKGDQSTGTSWYTLWRRERLVTSCTVHVYYTQSLCLLPFHLYSLSTLSTLLHTLNH